MAFDPTINLGNILIFGGIVVGVIGAYFKMNSAVETVSSRLQSNVDLINVEVKSLKDGVSTRHTENQRAFDGVTRAFDESRAASKELTREITSLVTRVAVVETKLQKDGAFGVPPHHAG